MHRRINSQSQIIQVLSIRPFFLLWLAQLLSQISVNMLTFVLAVLVYAHTKSNTSVSLLYLTVGLPAAVFGVVSGVYVDRYNKRTLLMITTLVRMLLILFLALIKPGLILVYVVTGFIAVASQFFVPAEAALIPNSVPEKLLLPANSLFTLTFYSAIIGGFVAGGPLLGVLGQQGTFIFLALALLLSTVCIASYPDNKNQQEKAVPQITVEFFLSELRSAVTYLKNTPIVGKSILLLTLAQAIIAVFLTLGPGYADRVLTVRLTDASIFILGPAAVGMILGAILIGQFGHRFRKKTLISTGLLVSGILILILSVLIKSRDLTAAVTGYHRAVIAFMGAILPLSLLVFFLLGVANSLIDISSNTAIQEHTTDAVRGKMYGLLASLVGGVAILPVVVSGVLADIFGLGAIIFVLGVVLTSFGIYTTRN